MMQSYFRIILQLGALRVGGNVTVVLQGTPTWHFFLPAGIAWQSAVVRRCFMQGTAYLIGGCCWGRKCVFVRLCSMSVFRQREYESSVVSVATTTTTTYCN